MSTLLVVILILLAAGILLLVVEALRLLASDRALKNDRSLLPRGYELPYYFLLKPSGEIDTSARWPGWDGWYFFMTPEDGSLPVKMVRASIMTGLYGLQGIDNYEKLLLRLSTFNAVEHLVLTPTLITVPDGSERSNYLSHRYLPKKSHLKMETDSLDVTVRGAELARQGATEQYGRIRGAWPNYQLDFVNPEDEIKISLRCKARDIIWWSDIPGIFTYFAAFGDFEGTITYQRGIRKDSPDTLMHREETFALKGKGAFEHGFARKPFDYDGFAGGFRVLDVIVPSLKAVRYHYELFLDGGTLHGGFMNVRAFGITLRDRGGVYQDGVYRRFRRVKIEYSKEQNQQVSTCRGGQFTNFHRQWTVRAETEDGTLEYTGIREWPPASVSDSMIYYNFSYSGAFRGQAISGTGYGEYLCM